MPIIILILLFSLNHSFSQTKSNKNFEVAEAYFNLGEYSNAIEYYQAVYKKNRSIDIARKIAKCFYLKRDRINAETWFLKVVKSKKYTSNDIIDYFSAAKFNGNYGSAKNILSKFLQADSLSRSLIETCDSSIVWLKNPEGHFLENMKGINTEYSEIAPVYYKDGLVYASTREGKIIKKKNGFSKEPYYDLYLIQKKDSGSFGIPSSFSFFLNTETHEGPVTFNKDFTEIYITRCDGGKQIKNNHLKMYKAKKKLVGWSEPEHFMINDSAYSFGHPSISTDERLFFFASDIPGGYGGVDIYVCILIDSAKWSMPINLGPKVNTEYNELFPFIHQTGILYYSSDRITGMGGFDIYSASVINGVWQNVKNLKSPINSSQDDFSFILNERGSEGYLSSNRKGGKGGEDIYRVKLEIPLSK